MTLDEKIAGFLATLEAKAGDLESQLVFVENRIKGVKKLQSRAKNLPADEQLTLMELMA